MSFANLGNIFVPDIQATGASNSSKSPMGLFFQSDFLALKTFNFLETLKLSPQRFSVFMCTFINV